MGVIDDVGAVSGFAAVQDLVLRGLGDLSGPIGFLGARPGMQLAELRAWLGEPTVQSDDTLEYEVPLDHPEEGPRQHHTLRLVMNADASGRVGMINVVVTYFGTGELAPAWNAVTKAIQDHVVAGLGKPASKRSSGSTWMRGDEQLWMLAKNGDLQMSFAV